MSRDSRPDSLFSNYPTEPEYRLEAPSVSWQMLFSYCVSSVSVFLSFGRTPLPYMVDGGRDGVFQPSLNYRCIGFSTSKFPDIRSLPGRYEYTKPGVEIACKCNVDNPQRSVGRDTKRPAPSAHSAPRLAFFLPTPLPFPQSGYYLISLPWSNQGRL